jgi:hypothetical protein
VVLRCQLVASHEVVEFGLAGHGVALMTKLTAEAMGLAAHKCAFALDPIKTVSPRLPANAL